MKKIVSNTLYVLFFGFALTLVIACVMLIINISQGEGQSYLDIEAVKISNITDRETKYNTVSLEVETNTTGGFLPMQNRHGYEALKDDKKEYLYNHLMESIYSISDEADEHGHYRISRIKVWERRLSEFDIREVINAFISDNPEYFWIENLFGYAYSDEDTIIEFYSVLSAADCERYIRRFNEKINAVLSAIPDGKNEYEREKQIHDILLKNCVYKTGVTGSADGWQYFTAYGAIVEGEAVCEGYAKSMQILLSRAGIPCSMVRGDAGGVAHMWNVVELGGKWYHLDPTWDDNDTEGTISYEYFNLTQDAILKNHTICEDIESVVDTEESESIDPLVRYNFYIPMCNQKAMNYYYVEGVLIQECSTADEEQLTAAIFERAKNQEVYVPIRFGNQLTFTDYVSKLFYESPYLFYVALEKVNVQLDDQHKIDLSAVSFLKNEADRTVRIRLKPAAEDSGE